MKLSPHFSLVEFCITSTGINNSPEPEHFNNLRCVAFSMEQVRALLGHAPISITSGYRNKAVNNAVGGVAISDHTLGWAVDFRHSQMTAYKAAKMICDSFLMFDQLILERNNTLIHLSFNPRFRRQILRQPGGPGSLIFNGID